MDRYGLLGHPVGHSLSPQIHGLFAQQSGRVISYELFDVAPGAVGARVLDLARLGYRGLNVTVPHKREALALATDLTRRAKLAGAVNTLVLDGKDTIHGDNTDGVGLVRDLTGNLGLELCGLRILLMGAGGAAIGVIPSLLTQQPGSLTVANRDAAKAERVLAHFVSTGELRTCEYGEVTGDDFDLVINATAAGLSGGVPPLSPAAVNTATVCYDMAYGKAAEAFSRWARNLGVAAVHDGLGMLVEQAAEAFHVWRGIRPDTRPVLAALAA